MKYTWQMDPGRFIAWVTPFLLSSLLASVIIRFFFGGLVKIEGEVQISGVAAAYTPFLSVLRMLGDPFVLLLMALIIFHLAQIKSHENYGLWTVVFLLLITAILQFIAVGLRGSRSVILNTVVLVSMMIHFKLRPFSRKWILIGLALTLTFLYLYDFRKKAGLIGWKAFYDAQIRKSLSYEMGGHTFLTTVLSDLSRADLQALMVTNVTVNKQEIHYEPVWGKTYMTAFMTFIPRAIWKNKPSGVKRDAGTVIQGMSMSGDTSSRQYGLAGEAILNFGFWGVIPAFCVFGILMGYVRKKFHTMELSDSRIYIFPVFIILLQNMVFQDSDNWMFAMLRDGTMLFFLIHFSSFKYRLHNPYN